VGNGGAYWITPESNVRSFFWWPFLVPATWMGQVGVSRQFEFSSTTKFPRHKPSDELARGDVGSRSEPIRRDKIPISEIVPPLWAEGIPIGQAKNRGVF
jgi:hypothetical protein